MWMLKEKMKKNDHKGAPAWPFGAARQRYDGVVPLLKKEQKSEVDSVITDLLGQQPQNCDRKQKKVVE